MLSGRGRLLVYADACYNARASYLFTPLPLSFVDTTMLTPSSVFNDVYIIEPRLYEDERGFFMETFRQEWLNDLTGGAAFVQDNHSASHQGVLRGLHYQLEQPQGKLVRVVAGRVFDVIVDMRRSSPTFGRWQGFELSADNRHQLWVPPGFAHGFYTLSERAECLYRCTGYFHAQRERILRWDDPDLAISWPLQGVPK